jgi:hypothetical protein
VQIKLRLLSYPVNAALVAPRSVKQKWFEITWKAEAGARPIGGVTNVCLRERKRRPVLVNQTSSATGTGLM